MGLDDPSNKMSKSLAHVRGHAVRLLDEPKEIMRTFKKAVTDSGREIAFSDDPEKAGVNNLLGIYKAVTGKGEEAVLADFADARGYGDLKKRVGEVVVESLRPLQERYRLLMDDQAELDRLLAEGAMQARAVSMPKVAAMKEMMGLVLPD
jgi:tryptophanyl-tRNA synthetase